MDSGPPTSTRTVAFACWTLILLSAVLCLVRLLHAQPLNSANDRSRWCTVRSLVELDADRPGGPYEIGRARQVRGWDTIDIVRHEGHFYSSKPPLLATIVAGLYWVELKSVGWTFRDNLEPATRLILLVLNLVPMIVALILLVRLIRELSGSPFTAVFVAAAATLGTLLLPFLSVLNNHTVAATAVVFALYPLIRILQGHDSGWRYALVGFWAAFACCNELPAAAFGVATFGLLLRKSPRRTLLWFAPAALIPLLAFFYSNYLATGGWKPFYAYYGTDKYEYIHEGVPSYWMNPRGLDANRDRFGAYLLHCTIGHHGLFSLTPVLLLTVLGWTTLPGRRRRDDSGETITGTSVSIHAAIQPVHWLGAALTLIVFTFYMTRTNNYNYGGVSVALRWMLWLTPFWLLAMVPAIDVFSGVRRTVPRMVVQSTACLFLAVSTFSAWYPLDGPWKQPWLFTLMEEAGWIDYNDPRPEFDREVPSWIWRLPTGDLQHDYWIELEGRQIDGSVSILRIEDAGPIMVGADPARMIRLTRREWGRNVWNFDVALSIEAFESGAAPAEFVVWPADAPSAEEQERVHTILSGLPGAVSYELIQDRYPVKVPLRTDAFLTYRARVLLNRHRREVWLSDEVPFGVVQMLDQVTDADGVVISRQNLSAVRAGRMLAAPAE